MTYLPSNLKKLRKDKGITQQELANKLGIKRSLIGSYEEGRAEPKLETMQNLALFYGLSIDDLITINMEVLRSNDTIADKEAKLKDVEGKGLRVLPITVDDKNEEKIAIVPVPAAAGYLVGYSDREYIEELPRFTLPILQSKSTCRVFQIKGDSMLPVQSGSFIIAEYILNWHEIKDGETYVVITKDEGIVYKRLYNHLKKEQNLELKSDNSQYQSYKLPAKEIIEVWKAVGYISFSLPKAEDVATSGFLNMMHDMKSDIQQIANKLQV